MKSFEYTITDPVGIHARPAGLLVKEIKSHAGSAVNIIKGEMSIVGPRAIQRTKEFTPHEAQRLLVKPGLTCYWQVMGRSRIDWEDWVELDLDYIQDMSIWTDVKIIIKTFGAVLHGDGSY